MKIVLVRHGFSEGNKAGTYTGWSDVPLANEGIEELHQLKKEYSYPLTDRYYSSDLTRAIQTFDILFGDNHTLEEISPDLREIFFGEYEGVHGDSVNEQYHIGFFLNNRIANGETVSQFSYRVISKLEAILKDMKEKNCQSATIVCHSGVIKTLLIFLEHRPFSQFREIETPNGLGYILDLDFDSSINTIKLNSVTEISKK